MGMASTFFYRFFLAILFCMSPMLQNLHAQEQGDSCTLRISLITCSPGAELYSTFGHSALRVVDQAAGTDIVYNYGVFDFYDPQFYSKFVRGKLLYYLDQQAFPDFLIDYQRENRSVREQVMDLSCDEKISMQQFLFTNIRPENKFYKYDFLFDNCTTRLRDLILRQSGKSYQTGDILEHKPTSFRDHLHIYLNRNQMPWSKLGIDILLGSRLDRKMSNEEAMFLPDYLEKGIDSSHAARSLVLQKSNLFQQDENILTSGGFPLSPALIGWLLLALTLAATLIRGNAFKGYLAFIDFMIFFITGLIGLLLVFMWAATDHIVCRDNLNMLWALPTHVVAAFYVRSIKPAWKKYFHTIAILSALLLAGWAFLPQRLNPALIPFVIIAGLRAWTIAGRQTGFIWKDRSSFGEAR
jgi:Domain of unknown function (DUF4105)